MHSTTLLSLALAATVQGQRPGPWWQGYGHRQPFQPANPRPNMYWGVPNWFNGQGDTSTRDEHATMYGWGGPWGHGQSSSTDMMSMSTSSTSSTFTDGGIIGTTTPVLLPSSTTSSTMTTSSTFTDGGIIGTTTSVLLPSSTTSSTMTTSSTFTDGGIIGTTTSVLLTSSTTSSTTTTSTTPVTTTVTSTSVLLPADSGTDIVTPSSTTSSTTTTSTTTTTTTTTMTTMPSSGAGVTNGNFFIVFDTPVAKRQLRKRDIAYLTFDNNDLSILVNIQDQAAVFSLMNNMLVSGSLFVTYNNAAQPPRFSLEATAPVPSITVVVNMDGSVSFTGVAGFCLQRLGALVVIANGEATPADCQIVRPQLIPAPAMSSTTTSSTSSQTTSSTMSSVSSTSTTSTSTSSSSQMSSSVSATLLPTSSSTTSTGSSTSTTSSASTSMSSSTTSTTSSTSTSTSSPSMSTTSSTSTSTSSTSVSTTSSTSTSITSTSTSTTSSTSTSTTTASTTTTSAGSPLVTDQAYIDTVLRHHNAHRANHTVGAITWSDALAATAKKIADTCVYAHDTTTDCPADANGNQGRCYGQNIGAGYLSTQMGSLITEGFYNAEVNSYTYYGGEPDTSTVNQWGHFSQIVWANQDSVGCYTTDCTATGLGNIAANSGIPPYFTVCNYNPAGNVIGQFTTNVLASLNQPTIYAGYQCPSTSNCVNGST